MEDSVEQTLTGKKRKYNSRIKAWLRCEVDGPHPLPAKSEDSFDMHSRNPKRFMGIIHAPILNPRTGSPEKVFRCFACYRSTWGDRDDVKSNTRLDFTDKTFQDHIREYGEVEDGRHKGRVD